MDAVGGGGDGDVGAGVDEQTGWGLCGRWLRGFCGRGDEIAGGEVFFAELDEVDALGGPAGGLAEEGGLLEVVVAGKERSLVMA